MFGLLELKGETFQADKKWGDLERERERDKDFVCKLFVIG